MICSVEHVTQLNRWHWVIHEWTVRKSSRSFQTRIGYRIWWSTDPFSFIQILYCGKIQKEKDVLCGHGENSRQTGYGEFRVIFVFPVGIHIQMKRNCDSVEEKKLKVLELNTFWNYDHKQCTCPNTIMNVRTCYTYTIYHICLQVSSTVQSLCDVDWSFLTFRFYFFVIHFMIFCTFCRMFGMIIPQRFLICEIHISSIVWFVDASVYCAILHYGNENIEKTTKTMFFGISEESLYAPSSTVSNFFKYLQIRKYYPFSLFSKNGRLVWVWSLFIVCIVHWFCFMRENPLERLVLVYLWSHLALYMECVSVFLYVTHTLICVTSYMS